MIAVRPAQIGADWEVPPPAYTCCWNTIRAPVNGSAAAATSGESRWEESRSEETLCCQSGRANTADTPPLLPIVNGGSNHACSASQTPDSSSDNAVPPTAFIPGNDEIASRPTSAGPG